MRPGFNSYAYMHLIDLSVRPLADKYKSSCNIILVISVSQIDNPPWTHSIFDATEENDPSKLLYNTDE